jgi:hypothetical protein
LSVFLLLITEKILKLKKQQIETDVTDNLKSGHYLWRGVAPRRNVFRGKNFADPTIEKSKHLITQPRISIKK